MYCRGDSGQFDAVGVKGEPCRGNALTEARKEGIYCTNRGIGQGTNHRKRANSEGKASRYVVLGTCGSSLLLASIFKVREKLEEEELEA